MKPGEVSFRVEKEGYEPQDVAFVIKPGGEGKADPVRLVPMLGSAVISSEPSGLRVVLEGNSRRYEGITPFTQPMLSPGNYRVTLQRARWQPVVKQLLVERGKETPFFADLQGVAWDIRSEPAGATVTLDGNPAGVTPLRLEELEPRSHRLALSFAGFEDFAQTYSAGKNDVLTIKLVEKPLTAILRRLTGHTWRYQSGWGYAEFAFDSNGNITGSHKIPLAAVMEDIGRIQSLDAGPNKFAVTFTPSRPYPFYTGEVTMQLLDDNNLKLNWRYNGVMQNYTYSRTDAAAGVSKNVSVFMEKAAAEEAARRKKK